MKKQQGTEVVVEKVEPQPADESGNAGVEDKAQGAEELLLAAQAELAEYRDKMLRAAAEFDNSKKRLERDRLNTLKYAGEPILREMLPVVDNLERALAQGEAASAGAEKNLAALLEGVQLTLKGLLVSLEKFEVKAIDSIGQPFNPNIQEALAMETSDVAPTGHVLSEYEKGYQYKDRLLRVAKVIVSSGKGAA